MILFPFIHTYSECTKRTRTSNLRLTTAEARNHPWQPRVISVGDPDCIHLDLYRWETDGGALIAD